MRDIARRYACPTCGSIVARPERPVRVLDHPRYFSGSTYWQITRERPLQDGRMFAILEGKNGTWIAVTQDGDRWLLPNRD